MRKGDTIKAPSTKLQAPEKLQTPSSKRRGPASEFGHAACKKICKDFRDWTSSPLEFDAWNFSGTWSLVLGASFT
jgi:hypothetical protein